MLTTIIIVVVACLLASLWYLFLPPYYTVQCRRRGSRDGWHYLEACRTRFLAEDRVEELTLACSRFYEYRIRKIGPKADGGNEDERA